MMLTLEERYAARVLRGMPRIVQIVAAPFGIARVEAVLTELGLGVQRAAEYDALCDARAARQAADPRAETEFCVRGIDARLRLIAASRVLAAVGGIEAAVRWSHVEELSRDARRWYDFARGGGS